MLRWCPTTFPFRYLEAIMQALTALLPSATPPPHPLADGADPDLSTLDQLWHRAEAQHDLALGIRCALITATIPASLYTGVIASSERFDTRTAQCGT